MPYVVKLIKAGKVHGMMGPYTTLKTAKRDAQMLADGAEKGVKVYVEQDVPSYLGGTGEGPHYKAKRSTSTKRHPKGTAAKPAGFFSGGAVFDATTGQPFPASWTGYAFSEDHDAVMKVGRSGGERSFDVARLIKNPKRNPHLKPGDRVKVDGYTGTVVRDLGGDQYEVRMPGGLAVKSLAGVPPIRGGRAKGGKASPTVSSPVTAKKRRSVAARKGAAKRKNPDTDVVSDMGDVYVERDRIDGTYSVVVYDGSRYLVASEWTREAPAIKDAKAWRSMPIRGRRAAIAASYKRNPSRKQMENAIAGKMPPGSKKGRGASRVIMLTGDSAKVLGVKNYTKLLMASLTDDQVDTLHNFLVLRMPIASSNRRNPSAGSKWALSKTVGFDDVVLSLHKTRDAAQKVYDKKYDHGMMGPTVRILEVGPNAPSEIIKVFGKRVIRPRT